MSCYYPRARIELNQKDGKNAQGKIKHKCEIIPLSGKDEKENIKNFENMVKHGIIRKFDIIPCGKCIGCQLAKSRDWANRLTLESKYYELNEQWFLTLTYNDVHLPLKQMLDQDTGEVKTIATLKKDHVTKFLKDLRDHERYHKKKDGIRFYMCGEYGTNNHRPHYHMCIFGLNIEDLKPYKQYNGHQYWTSETLEKIWGRGFVVIARLTWETCAYTARYMMKDQGEWNTQDFYIRNGYEPPYTNMSRMPGIGSQYYQDNKERIYKTDGIAIPKSKGASIIKPPRYYDKLFDLEDHYQMQKIKITRKQTAQKALDLADRRSSLSREEQRHINESIKKEQIKKLKRPIEM